MSKPFPSPVRHAAASAGTLLLAASLLAPSAVADPDTDAGCVPPGGDDANGDGFDDARVSPLTLLIDAELDCSAEVGAGSVIVGARLVQGGERPDERGAIVGERSFVGPGTTIEGASIGDRVIVLRGATIAGGISDETVLGDDSFVGRGSEITNGDGPTRIGDGARIFSQVLLRGVEIGPNARIGSGVEIKDFDAGAGLFVGTGTTIEFEAGAADDVRIGARSRIGPFSFIGPDTTLGRGTELGSTVFLGARNVIGEQVTIGGGADLGDDVQVGDFARIGERAVVPDGTVIGSGESFPGPS